MLNLTDKFFARKFCREHHLLPTRSAGQHFLVSDRVLQKIISVSELAPYEKVLEIGAGLGTLSVELARRAGQVVAVEWDKGFFSHLETMFAPMKHVRLLRGDVLSFSNQELVACFGDVSAARPYKLVANLPYNITSAVLEKFLEQEPKPFLMVVMAQKEVGERICARPGEMSLLSLSVQFFAKPKKIMKVSKGCFWPVPKVDSMILKISDIHSNTEIAAQRGVTPQDFFYLAKIGFSSRRKQLQNNLAVGLRISNETARQMLCDGALRQDIRAQDLSVEDWIGLVKRMNQTLGKTAGSDGFNKQKEVS